MVKTCTWCHINKASIKRPKTGAFICKDCFFVQFEEEIHQTITQAKLFLPGQKVAIGASGGKGTIEISVLPLCILLLNAYSAELLGF